jgi:hypothetical protein
VLSDDHRSSVSAAVSAAVPAGDRRGHPAAVLSGQGNRQSAIDDQQLQIERACLAPTPSVPGPPVSRFAIADRQLLIVNC